MTELERISDQIKRAYEGNAWHGPAVKEVLAGVSADQAARTSIAGAHSIWDLVLHIAAWTDIVRRRIRGEVVDVTSELNFPTVSDTSETAWQKALLDLERSQQEMQDFIPTILESTLNNPVMEGGTTIYIQLHGVAQHHIYHAGQIVMLKRAAA